MQAIQANPGETYLVRASALAKNSQVLLSIKWRDSEKPTLRSLEIVEPFIEELKDGWRRASLIVTVPEGASAMTVIVKIKSNGSHDYECLLDDICAYKLFE